MATATVRKSRVYTISLPPELAQRAEALAQRDSRTMSELFREPFRTYSAQQARSWMIWATMRQSATRRAVPRPESPGLIQQVRAGSRAPQGTV